MDPLDITAIVYFISYGLLALLTYIFIYRNKDINLKRKWHTHVCIANSLLFFIVILFFVLYGFPFQTIYMTIPALIFITYIQIKTTIFCDSCGKMSSSVSFIKKDSFCSKCGAKTAT